jgi:putative membrane protein
MMWYWGSGVHWWGWLFGTVGMLAFWGVIIWGVWYLVTGPSRRPDHPQAPGDVKRILDERLARGEISPEEYGHLLSLIRGEGARAGNGQSTAAGGGRL